MIVQEVTYSQHGKTVNRLGKSEVSNFDDRRYVIRQEDVLWLEVTMSDALAVDVLQRKTIRTIEETSFKQPTANASQI